MLESLLAGAIALAQPQLAEAFYTHPHVKQVVCDEARGSAFRLSTGRFASVWHVSRHSNCKIGDRPITIEHEDPVSDFSIVTIENDWETGGIEVDCHGYQEGNWYYSVGFARGWPASVTISIRNGGPFLLNTILKGWSIFKGVEYVIPGMSGGPILDIYGKAVGTVNAYNDTGLSWSRPLKETILCQL